MRKLLLVLTMMLVVIPATLFAKDEPAKKKFDAVDDINKPRPDARKIAFTTDEGTWLSLDLSPDGQTIVFDILGDLYAMPVSGGSAHSLTRGPAWDTNPRFSPDGKTIAFTSDRGGIDNIWLMDADGKNPRALTDEKACYVRSAAWSPDGQYLVARKEDAKRGGIPPVELWVYNVHGGSGVKLTSQDELNNSSGPLFSADGRYIYFSVRQRRFSYTPDMSNGLWQIARYDRRTGEVTTLTNGIGGAVRPALTPDGKTLLFISRREEKSVLVARDLASGRERIVTPRITRDEQEGFTQLDLWPGYAITRDGQSAYITNEGKIVRVDIASGKETPVPFSVDVEQYAAPRVAWQEHVESGPVHARILRWATQTPDASAVVFDAMGRIWVQRLANGKADGHPVRLTKDDAGIPAREYAPSISPDGQWIAYVTWSDADGGQVWKARLSNGAPADAPQKLTTIAGHYINPEWSPKGDKLVVIQGTGEEFRGHQPEDDDTFDIRLMSSNGGTPEFVTTVKVADTFRFHPQAWFSADGTRLYFREFIAPEKPHDDPKNELVSLRLDGTDKKHLLRFPTIGDLVPSPDEQWVAFTSRDNVYVAALPNLVLKEPPDVSTKEGTVPVWRLSEEAGGYVDWADGGKTITWTLGNQFHRLPLASAIAFVEEEKRKAAEKDKKKDKSDDAVKTTSRSEKGDKKEKGDDDSLTKLKVPKSESIAIDLEMPRPAPAGTFVLRNARVITMKGDEVIEHADVVVTGNKIAAVGASGKVNVPAGAKEIDAAGKTIIPGFIDTHAHLHYSGYEIFPELKWEYACNLAYGVTTVYDPSAPSLDVFGQAEMVEAGLMVGPRVYSSGDVLYGGQQEDIFSEVDSLDDAVRQVRRMKAYGARMIKVYQQPGRAQRIWFAEASQQEHMLLTAEGAGELASDLSMSLDGFTACEHAMPVELRKDVIQFLSKSGTFYTPTLLVAYGGPWGEEYFWQTRNPHDDAKLRRFTPHPIIDAKARRHLWIDPSEYFFPTVAAGAAKVLSAGGHVSLGAHGQVQGLGPHWEIWAMAGEGGAPGSAMTPLQALQASTILAADKLGFAPDLGSVETGKLADLIVLDANPLDDIHNSLKIRYVIKNGDLFDGDTLTKEWPDKQELPKFFWQ